MTARFRGRDGQAGITVVEMVTVVALLSVVLALAFQSLSSYQRANAGSEARLRNLEEARLIMAVITRDLRTATEFDTTRALSAGDVTFAGHLGTTAAAATTTTSTTTTTAALPENWVRLCVDAQGRLLETITALSGPAPSGSCAIAAGTRVVGQGIQVASGSPFEFRDADGDPTTTHAEVASVAINLSVDLPSSAPAPPAVLSGWVFLPNIAAERED
jgi:Tfp pilus assembly protein PilW